MSTAARTSGTRTENAGDRLERKIDELIRAAAVTPSSPTATDVRRGAAIFVEHQPAIYFAAPRLFIGSSTRVGNVTPAVVRPQMLWSPDTITVTR